MKSNSDNAYTTPARFPSARNSASGYGWVAIGLHWLVAITVFALFGLGFWMTGLTYYDEWYKLGPQIHKSVGLLLFLLALVRLAWRLTNTAPKDEPGIGRLERMAAHGAHHLLHLLIFCVMVSGYLISTADGRAVEVFSLFHLPALVTSIPNQEDIAGKVHWYLALSLVSLAALHALAALKHHFINRDRTLLKMLGIGFPPSNHTQ